MARYKPGTGPYSKESSLDEDDLKWFFSGKDEGYLQGLEAYHEALLSFVQESYDFCTELGPCSRRDDETPCHACMDLARLMGTMQGRFHLK